MMYYILILNLVCFFSFSVYKVYFFSKYIKSTNLLFNPIFILFIFECPVLISKVLIGPAVLLEDSLIDKYYNFSLFVTNVQIGCEILLILVVSKLQITKRAVPNFKVNITNIRWGFIVFLVLAFTSFLLLTIRGEFGFWNWISDPRTGYQYYKIGNGGFWILAISFLAISMIIVCIYSTNYILYSILIIFLCTFLGSKGVVLAFCECLAAILLFKQHKYAKSLIVFLLPLGFLAMLYNFFSTDTSTGELKSVFEYFDYFVHSAMYYETYFNGEIDLFYGKIFITDFWGIVPRAIYPNKPFVYGFLHVNEYFWPGLAEQTVTPAFADADKYYADFGIIGVIIFTFFNPLNFIKYYFYFILLRNFKLEAIKNNLFLLLLFIVFFAPDYLLSVSFPLNFLITFIVFIVLILINGNSKKISNSKNLLL